MTTTTKTVLFMCAVFSATQVRANDENTFRAIGKISENSSNHTTKHEHELQFVRLDDGEIFDIVDSLELVKSHCESEKNTVIEIEGHLTGKFLFWGGDLVVTSFKIHQDIEVPKIAHLSPQWIAPKRRFHNHTHGGPRRR